MSTLSLVITRPGRTVLCLLLALLFVSERALPCSDHDRCVEDESTCTLHIERTSDDADPSSVDCTGSYCSCTCHAPAVIEVLALISVEPLDPEHVGVYNSSRLSTLVHPLDHVPLL